MRVYVPLTLVLLRAAVSAGGVSTATAFAVTPALREWYASGDTEELEFAAMTDAAEASLRLLATDPDAPRQRVVIAADVVDGAVRLDPDRHPAALAVLEPIPVADFASVHVDDPGVAEQIRDAAASIAAADAGDEDAAFVVSGIEDHQLQWYGVQELPALLG
jgi:hypothetical protein